MKHKMGSLCGFIELSQEYGTLTIQGQGVTIPSPQKEQTFSLVQLGNMISLKQSDC